MATTTSSRRTTAPRRGTAAPRKKSEASGVQHLSVAERVARGKAARSEVARADHATDRRAWVIHLTPAGKALITRVFAGHQDAMEKALSGLSRAERTTLTDLLKRLGTTAAAQLDKEEGATQ